MGKIQVLEKQVAELIAAGEVVERPASVIKELVENAIDAGATLVTVEIQNGGVRYMRVSDNGSGIARGDIPTAFLRHATSKIHKEDDLDSISTLGFRGEALAAVCAVSRVELLTRTKEELAGSRYLIEGGTELLLEDAGCPEGTTIIVRDIFYNTPARMKFLKKDVSEGSAVASVVDRVALSHPEVSVRLIRDGKETLHTPGDGKLASAIYAVCGREFAASLLPIEYEQGGIGVSGYICKPVSCRPNRNMQFFFINGRLVKSRTAMAALEQGYRNAAMTGKFPTCVLHLAIPYGAVDVNVHPAKTEVRFSDEKRIFDTVYCGVKTTLAGADFRPGMSLTGQTNRHESHDEKPAQPSFSDIRQADRAAPPPIPPVSEPSAETPVQMEFSVRTSPASGFSDFGRPLYNTGKRGISLDIAVDDEDISPAVALPEKQADTEIAAALAEPPAGQSAEEPANPPEEAAALPQLSVRLIGEAFGTYALVEQGSELILLDKHAAHERILFEELQNSAEPKQQLLLQPVAVSLPKEEYAAVLESADSLRETGFEVDDFGSGSVLVRAVPVALSGEDIPSLIAEIAGDFLEHHSKAEPEKLQWLYHSIACRAAVKAGNRTTARELQQLAERVLCEKDIYYCPHGRPVAIRLTRKEIEKQFGRA